MILQMNLFLLYCWSCRKNHPKELLLGDFNIDLFKYEISDSINNSIDILSSNFLLPLIFLPTRISKTSTLIDNNFSNLTSLEETELGNVTSTFSNHLLQFIFSQDFFSKVPGTKSDILRRDWKNFKSSKFISDFNQIKWKQILYNDNNDVNFSMNEYLSKTNSLLDAHAQLKNLTKRHWNFSANHGLHEVCKTLLKKNIYSNLWNVKTKYWNNFITIVTKIIEISYLHSSKGLKKSISQTFSMKTSKM